MKKKSKILRKFPAPEKGKLFIVSAPSGAGKTTMCRKLSAVVPCLKHSVSCTTRAPRKGEVRNVHYTFISKEKFRTMIKKEEFAEWAVVHGNLYGTPAKRLIQITKKGYDIILDIDTQGAMQMRRRFKDAVYIFILPPSMKILEKRLRGWRPRFNNLATFPKVPSRSLSRALRIFPRRNAPASDQATSNGSPVSLVPLNPGNLSRPWL